MAGAYTWMTKTLTGLAQIMTVIIVIKWNVSINIFWYIFVNYYCYTFSFNCFISWRKYVVVSWLKISQPSPFQFTNSQNFVFILSISDLTIPSVPIFIDRTFQVPIICASLKLQLFRLKTAASWKSIICWRHHPLLLLPSSFSVTLARVTEGYSHLPKVCPWGSGGGSILLIPFRHIQKCRTW